MRQELRIDALAVITARAARTDDEGARCSSTTMVPVGLLDFTALERRFQDDLLEPLPFPLHHHLAAGRAASNPARYALAPQD